MTAKVIPLRPVGIALTPKRWTFSEYRRALIGNWDADGLIRQRMLTLDGIDNQIAAWEKSALYIRGITRPKSWERFRAQLRKQFYATLLFRRVSPEKQHEATHMTKREVWERKLLRQREGLRELVQTIQQLSVEYRKLSWEQLTSEEKGLSEEGLNSLASEISELEDQANELMRDFEP